MLGFGVKIEKRALAVLIVMETSCILFLAQDIQTVIIFSILYRMILCTLLFYVTSFYVCICFGKGGCGVANK